MYGYNRRPIRSGSSLIDVRVEQDTEPLPLNRRNGRVASEQNGKSGTDPLILSAKGASENEQEMPLTYHVNGIVRAVRKSFKAMSPVARVVVILFALSTLCILENILIHFVLLSIGSIYTVLGILASAIVVYEFLTKRQRKKS